MTVYPTQNLESISSPSVLISGSYCSWDVPHIYRFMVGPDGKENISHRDWLIMFEQVVNEVKEDMNKQGRGDEFFGAKVS
jgi:adenosine deaminase CECR1